MAAVLAISSQASAQVKISQVYGAGGNTQAPTTNDYIEIYNAGAPQDLTGWSVQYASSSGTTWTVTALPAATILGTGQYLLIQEAIGTSVVAGQAPGLPAPQATGAIAMSATDFKVALVSSTTALVGGVPTYTANPTLVDFVGAGTLANWNDTAAAGGAFLAANNAPPPATAHAIYRAGCGATDTDNSRADWAVGWPAPRNTATALNLGITVIGSALPLTVEELQTVRLTATPFRCATSDLGAGTVVSVDTTAIGGGPTPMVDTGLGGDDLAGDGIYTAVVTVAAGTTTGTKSLPITVSDAGPLSGGSYISIEVKPTTTPDNDNCTGAIAVAVPSSTAAGLTGATVESNSLSPTVTTMTNKRGLWYTLLGNGNTLTAGISAATPTFTPSIIVMCGTCDGLTVISSANGPVTWCSGVGTTYFVWVSSSTTGATTNTFNLDITDSGTACATALPCPTCLGVAGPYTEIEPGYGPHTNDGCASAPNLFTNIASPTPVPTIIRGTARGMLGNRDVDAYRFQATTTGALTFTIDTLGANAQAQLVSLAAGGVCPQVSVVNTPIFVARCATGIQTATGTVTAGTWYSINVVGGVNLQASPASTVFGGQMPGGTTYQYVITAALAPFGACYLPNGSCGFQTQASCTTASGIYQGDGVACPASGACCIGSGCRIGIDVGPFACSASAPGQGGCYSGDGTTCALTTTNGENFDGVVAPALPAGWTAVNATGAAPLWVTSASGTPTPVADTAPNAAFVDDPATVSDKRLDSPSIAIGSFGGVLTFRHNYSFEGTTTFFDGGVLEISIGGGAFTDIITAGGSFNSGAYNGTISASFSNPIGGRQGWGGNTAGAFVTVSINLPAAAAGQSIVLRWRMGSDTSGSSTGWRVDSIAIQSPVCPAGPCGACCVNGTCQVTSSTTCSTLLGNFQGAGSTCPNAACTPLGACCLVTGCSLQSSADCNTAGGVYGGDSSSCTSPAPCQAPCCKSDGNCDLRTVASCNALAGAVAGTLGTSCPPSPCAPVGKCCSPDASTCTQVTAAACVAPNLWSPGTCAVNYNVPNTDCPPNFMDISATGTELLTFTSLDDSAVAVTLPFAFSFYGVPQTAASIGTNGWMVLGGGSAGGIPPDAPLSGTQANNAIYVYGEDLHLRGVLTPPAYEGHIYVQQMGTSPNSVYIVQWTNVDLFSPTQPNGSRNTFQVKLYEASGVIEMQYLSLNLTGLSPIPTDVVIGVRESASNFTEVSESVVGTGPKAIIYAPNGGCAAAIAPTGSCCITNQPCSVLTQAACQLACGAYQGNGTDCTSAPCATEACCLPQGGCNDSVVGVCTAAGGAPQGPGTTCGTTNCPPAGKCCTATGGCNVTLQASCQAAGSTWELGLDCTTPCAVGACCAADGTCSQLTEAGCTASNGIRWTAATPCSPNLCQGRCCAPDGTCSITAFNACLAPNIYGGDGSACSPANVCSGRCCLANGTCSVTGSGGCAQIGGTFTIGQDCSNTTVLTYDNIGLVIPDGTAGPTVTNIQVVAGLPTPLTDVDVDVFITHTFFADLVIAVEHNGVVVNLTDGAQACFGDNPDIVLDDEGTGGPIETLACPSGIVPTSPPNYTPLSPLSAFDAMDPNGPWTISIRDDAGLDTGTLIRWSLHIGVPGSVCPVACTCYGDMNGDTLVDGADVAAFTACVIAGGGPGCACADMDHVGGVTTSDIPGFISALLAGGCGP